MEILKLHMNNSGFQSQAESNTISCMYMYVTMGLQACGATIMKTFQRH